MKEFVKSYVEVQKHSNVWMKKHWKCLLAINVIGGIIYYVIWQYRFNKELTELEENILKARKIYHPTEES